jgi:hypothetical protein
MKKYICHSSPWPLVKMYMWINKKWQINQLEPFKKPWFVVVWDEKVNTFFHVTWKDID